MFSARPLQLSWMPPQDEEGFTLVTNSKSGRRKRRDNKPIKSPSDLVAGNSQGQEEEEEEERDPEKEEACLR